MESRVDVTHPIDKFLITDLEPKLLVTACAANTKSDFMSTPAHWISQTWASNVVSNISRVAFRPMLFSDAMVLLMSSSLMEK